MSKVVLITGATSGFGEATAIKFANAGYKVIITGRRQERLDALKAKLPQCDILPLCFDVSQKKDVFSAIQNLPADYKNIDILVNNAGLALGLEGAHNASLDDWEQMIDTNIKGLLYMTKPFCRSWLSVKQAISSILDPPRAVGLTKGQCVWSDQSICQTIFT